MEVRSGLCRSVRARTGRLVADGDDGRAAGSATGLLDLGALRRSRLRAGRTDHGVRAVAGARRAGLSDRESSYPRLGTRPGRRRAGLPTVGRLGPGERMSQDVLDTGPGFGRTFFGPRSEEHTSELRSIMRHSYAVFCLKKKNKN